MPSVGSGNEKTWWQSKTWMDYPNPLSTNITISMDHAYELQTDFYFQFNTSRPREAILEKSNDFGKTWETLQIYNQKCPKDSVTQIPNDKPDTVICTQKYSHRLPFTNGRLYFEVVADRFEPFLGQSLTNYEKLYETFDKTKLNSFLTFTDLRLRLIQPNTDGYEFGKQRKDLLRYFYGINDVQLIAGCQCNLHAKYCRKDNGTMACVCSHNTAGKNCEKCLPLYNNRPWKAGNYLPYPDGTANECESKHFLFFIYFLLILFISSISTIFSSRFLPLSECQCNDHAASCQFNKALNRGVCDNCTHNTMGNNCEMCKAGYYRNISTNLNDPNVCLDCDCELSGVQNNDTTCSHLSVVPGQCPCKVQVTGRRCDRCKDQYYGLLLPGSKGTCKECACKTLGTVGASNVCNYENGQCPCKDHIGGRSCSMCKEGFYQYPTNNQDDCKDCACDRGGSVSLVCKKDTGICTCRPGLFGRTCESIIKNKYVPYIDGLYVQPVKKDTTCSIISKIKSSTVKYTGRQYAVCKNGQSVSFDNVEGIERQTMILWEYNLGLRYSTNLTSAWGEATIELSVLSVDAGISLDYYKNRTNDTISPACSQPAGLLKSISLKNLTNGQAQSWLSSETVTIDARCQYSVQVKVGPSKSADTSEISIDAVLYIPSLVNSTVYIAS